ncbi:MAG: hypothetical protein JXL97_13735 [Bacteroidales bacterium]|nr:hypothetical protein [Bacteroidales bacterium]
MKNKNQIARKTILMLIFFFLIIEGCTTNYGWFFLPEVPTDQNDFIPDSLKFQIPDGSTVEFMNTKDSIEKFTISNLIEVEAIINHAQTMQIGDKELNNATRYSNVFFEQILYITVLNNNTYDTYFTYYGIDTNNQLNRICRTSIDTYYEKLVINEQQYYNVYFTEGCEDYFNGIFFNYEFGLLRYITIDKDTFDLYQIY